MIFNLISFNISWLGLVLLGNSFIPLTLLWLGLHFYFCKQRLAELKLVISIIVIGILVDSLLVLAGVFIFANIPLVPLWLIALWASFAATIGYSLNFLNSSKVLQFSVGCLFAPLSYLAGASLSVVELGHSALVTYLILAPIWGMLFLLFFFLKSKVYVQEYDDV
jgi:hypothetical protein